MASNPMAQEQVWFDKYRAEDAETAHYERQSGCSTGREEASPQQQTSKGSSLANEIARARQQIKNTLKSDVCQAAASGSAVDGSVLAKIQSLEKENQELRTITQNLAAVCRKLEDRITALEKSGSTNNHKVAPQAPAPAKKEEADEEDEDDFDLFDDDDEDEEAKEEAEKLRQERIDAYTAKKSKKPALIAKSSLLLDVKPWDDETDMAELEKCVRTIEMDGLLWGASKLAPVGYGIKKLVINCVVEDDKVSTDDLEEQITGFEDYVQSMDIAAFNKI